ncbi:MAG: UDP-N-acetylmuramoyl-L-alanyl-D-glutamate--2,6-diaminopimelate ligase [Candidatus Omnitrophota bacterium]|nr:UDP-N-acetylmuramoyl-L-alanyl-D-glutamate--2,6-diaminopimelate ligase [Candidatus Omnitrophota bacterium]
MRLNELLKGLSFKTKDDISEIDVKRVRDDSRAVEEGDLFIAVKGYSTEGSAYIGEAVKNGARVIMAQRDHGSSGEIKRILVDDTRKALSVLAANFYGNPSDRLKIVGITGTNGKTTITYIIESILKNAGSGAGVIGTVNYRLKDKVLPSKNTTPGALELQSLLAEMAKGGLHYAIMEISSHSLDQGRVDSVRLDTGIFTNISAEHLDYHKTIEEYFKAKAQIFGLLKDGATAILNDDDDKVASLKNSITKARVITYGIENYADVCAQNIRSSIDGTRFDVVMPKNRFEIRTGLIGMHNVSNILAGIAAAVSLNIGISAIKGGVESVVSVPGRLETLDIGQAFKIFVDYAHTEDALYNILTHLRKVAVRGIITVFGCGGNRDRLKRPLMGKVACRLSDHVVITSDNPRFEEPEAIIEEIEKGVIGKFDNYSVAIDRREAIKEALELAGEGDIVVIAGKGHEDYQIVKDKIFNFNDREIAKEILLKNMAVRK